MKKLHLFIVLLIFSIQTTFSQTKEIKGDTTYWYKSNIDFQKKLNLTDFEKSTDEFNFRFRDNGQVIEISKDSSGVKGFITNYIYHNKRANSNKTETLSNKIILSPKQAEDVYNIVQNSKIIDLPSDQNIESWKQGADGTTYIIEHSDKHTYWVKSYWTPSTQDSIPEAIIVLGLINTLSDTLNLNLIYKKFEDSLPRKGCYNSGGMVSMCYASNSLELGYSGATKLPLGFYSSYSATYLGKVKINAGAIVQYNFDNSGFHHLNLQVAKWNLFYKKSNVSDFIVYNYQNRVVNLDETKRKFENHQIKYGLNLKRNIAVGVGVDYLTGRYNKIGGAFYGHKWFSKPNIRATIMTTIFDNRMNYKVEILKSFNFNYKFLIRRIDFGIAYEEFMNYKDLYFSARVSL